MIVTTPPGGRVRLRPETTFKAPVPAVPTALPLPMQAGRFEPFLYGDYLWARIVSFVEFRDMAAERPPRRGGARQFDSR